MRASLHWGPVDALGAVHEGAAVAVVVDVLSFTTTLSVAADRAIAVIPHSWHDSAADLASTRGATLAVARGGDGVSLSPASVRRSTGVSLLVLPSPNGSEISHRLARADVVVAGGCLRNARATGSWAARSCRRTGGQSCPRSVAVVAAGERWPDGSLRPALEDLLGAGAVLATLERLGADLTPDAAAAVAAYVEARDVLDDRLRACPSGQELIGRGWAEDVEVAAELDASTAVPVLRDGVFRAER